MSSIEFSPTSVQIHLISQFTSLASVVFLSLMYLPISQTTCPPLLSISNNICTLLAVLISASTLTPIFTSLLTSTLLFMIHTMTGYIFACTYSIMRTYISSLPILFTFSYDTLPSSIFYHTSGIPPPPQSIKPPAPSVVSMSGSPSYLHNLPNK